MMVFAQACGGSAIERVNYSPAPSVCSLSLASTSPAAAFGLAREETRKKSHHHAAKAARSFACRDYIPAALTPAKLGRYKRGRCEGGGMTASFLSVKRL